MHVETFDDGFAHRVRIHDCAERLIVVRNPSLRAALRKELAMEILALRQRPAGGTPLDTRSGLAK